MLDFSKHFISPRAHNDRKVKRVGAGDIHAFNLNRILTANCFRGLKINYSPVFGSV